MQVSNVGVYLPHQTNKNMAIVKTNQKITCTNLEDAKAKADHYSNGVIIEKDKIHFVVNYKTYTELEPLGYKQVR